jgi:hypothetical protein
MQALFYPEAREIYAFPVLPRLCLSTLNGMLWRVVAQECCGSYKRTMRDSEQGCCVMGHVA